jgi:hypothetical protein
MGKGKGRQPFLSDADQWPPISHWSPRFLPLVERYGSQRVYEIGLEVIGWPPTIDISAGRQWVTTDEFKRIQQALESERVKT